MLNSLCTNTKNPNELTVCKNDESCVNSEECSVPLSLGYNHRIFARSDAWNSGELMLM